MITKTVSSPTNKTRRSTALVGNPYSGKTTIFNALTGLHHKVANYPGVTVERREARLATATDRPTWMVDLPGAYSLVSRSADEHITRDALLGMIAGVDAVDGVLIVIDAGNLERNLYMASQIIDLGYPVVLCCNMIDVAEADGRRIDLEALSERLGVPVVGTVGNRAQGIDELKHAVAQLGDIAGEPSKLDLPDPITQCLAEPALRVARIGLGREGHEEATALLMLCSSHVDDSETDGSLIPAALAGDIDRAIAQLREAGISEPETIVVQERYAHLRRILKDVVSDQGAATASRRSDRIDRIVTHPLLGIVIFAALMFVMFLAIFSWAEPVMDVIEALLGSLGEALTTLLPEGTLRSLLIDGMLAGVGAVVVFLPQICILFFFLSLLEDSGYMARAAMLMNRLMNAIGLPGKSFIPLLSSFACAIPGIMAARTIDNRRDRFVTIMIAPLMSCSARLPIYVILIGAVFAGSILLQAGIMLSMYLLGIVAALAVAWVLKHTILKGKRSGFIIELPPYRRPQLRVVLRAVWERAMIFLKEAGTIIFTVSILLWALAYFPRADQEAVKHDAGLQLRQSIMGRIGQVLEPTIEPLGFDWKIGAALTASFAAREVFVSTLGIVYGLGEEQDEASEDLRSRIAADTWPDGRKIYTPLTGISLMVFYVLACQCMSTLSVVKRETNSWRWPAFMFGYMTVLAYLASLAIFQTGSALGWGT